MVEKLKELFEKNAVEKNEVTTFEQQYMEAFKSLADLGRQTKAIKAEFDAVKDELLQAMFDNDIKQIDNEYVKITRVDESVSIGIDMKAFQMEAPEVYEEVKKNFNKETVRKPYLKITTK